MTCEHIVIDGVVAIVNHRNKHKLGCCVCRRFGDRLCDWKLPNGKTCDRTLCDEHTSQPAKNKDLCPEHAAAWAEHPANKQASLEL